MSRFIDGISKKNGIPNGLSVEDLYIYTKNLMFDYWDSNCNKCLKMSEKLALKIIELENNERAYNNYLFVLTNSQQYQKAYKVCRKLFDSERFRKFAVKMLTDENFVKYGFIDAKKYSELLLQRLSDTDVESERKHILYKLNKL